MTGVMYAVLGLPTLTKILARGADRIGVFGLVYQGLPTYAGSTLIAVAGVLGILDYLIALVVALAGHTGTDLRQLGQVVDPLPMVGPGVGLWYRTPPSMPAGPFRVYAAPPWP